jgi:predicted secreted acid phosphatase
MKVQGMLAAFLAVFFLAVSFSHAREPRNLDLIKQELIKYHDSGEYQKDIARVVQQAKAYLQTRLEENKKKGSKQKLAIILDIDETALSNYPDMVVLNFGGTLKQIEEAEGKGEDPAIEPTLELYQFAKAHEVAVFFITARKEIYKEATVANLEKVGYKDYDGLYLLPMDYHEKSVANFKTAIRKKITDQGYDIVLSLSDQKGDLKGGYAEKAFKLPDPYYLVP